nr:hypothetical protein CFP56_20789 [Quercus suber]
MSLKAWKAMKSHVVLGQRFRKCAGPGQLAASLSKRDLLPRKLTVVSDERHQPQQEVEINSVKADVETGKLGSKSSKEKLYGGKEKPDFEEMLRELDADISGKADTRCNMEKVLKARELESEVKESANQKEEKGGKDVMGCHAEKFLKARDLVFEVVVSESKKEDKEEVEYTYGPRRGP